MSLNTANTPDGKGVLIYNGEAILLYTKHVTMSFNHTNMTALKGKKNGSLYLTSHRIIFVAQCNDGMRSFSMPFFALRDVKLEQPILSPNYLKGTIQAQPGGNFDGEVTWKLSFSKGGCVDFGQALLQAADMAQRYRPYDAPPAYAPAPGNFFAAPPGYCIPQQNYHGFTAPTHAFPDQPPAGEVYMYESPPPYPGIAGPAQQVSGPPVVPPYPAGQIGQNVHYQPYGHPPIPTQNQPPAYSGLSQLVLQVSV
ncbi:unnamed protein product, partial [Mesorhabditis belari]|uniref:GRAM domain-containing protein n=1 Tax=Mesorhabditis belari TaxID=2138241 RepID=A0AAF3JAH3_9BILA